MRVLSLFDGIAGAMVALQNLGFKVAEYYSSEVDAKAMSVADRHFPDVIQVGDVEKLSAASFGKIDLLIGGSPCTNLSIAGDGSGLEGNESRLFFEYVRLLRELKPKWFVLENVKSMRTTDREAMDKIVGCPSVYHNSSSWTAQSRKRLYWTNITLQPDPVPCKIVVADILEQGDIPKNVWLNTHWPIHPRANFTHGQWEDRENMVKLFDIGQGRQGERIYSILGKSVNLTAGGGGPGSKTGVYYVGEYRADVDPSSVMASCRRLTPVEAERLQGIPDGYTEKGQKDELMSPTDRYRLLGNGFTVPAIMYLLEPLRAFYGMQNGGAVKEEEYRDATRGK